MRKLLCVAWFFVVSLLAARTELRACGWQAEGLEYRPYSIYCIWSVACGGGTMCENGACYDGWCVGWWQYCVFAPLCGRESLCSVALNCT